MKIFYSMVIILLLLGACQTTEKTAMNEEETDRESNREVTEVEEKDTTKEEEPEKEKSKEENNEEKYEINKANWTLEPIKEQTGENTSKVLLTIDDAPDQHSVAMAKMLAEEEVPAIFFVNGHFLKDEEGKKQLKEIAELGFEIGNHTMNHSNLNELTEKETEQEIITLNDTIEGITGVRPVFFRAPFGVNTDVSKQILKEEDMVWMNWTYGYDWEDQYMDAEALADIMVNTELLQNGANLLMHDREWTKNALPSIIEGFREKDYEFIDPDQIERKEDED
ncbi:polysaccharide deacetylase family protein [Alteribacillus iranensis]|uniref:Peptidoglycan/xylan/chitin deacetylase, PgdA/CDA1 family n=1 Tax=Alteribacillus iranensis TaxID=930128 RepID=A0A1I2AI71_9BACI|nr:polysaccharide deacetylase family protein [Alteribacillus iranensis]SFE42530.1 Peptidoglycan/xylan/chitin deacetylase, PgdA/CDA1 family [Alteribacillus iranensis]